MKKQVALAVAAALSLSVAGTALAAPANPFVDVPANHWAYDALAQLQKDGVVTGYGDGTFRGDRNLTRYEMAAMIAKITLVDDKNGPLIKKLQSEFATELYNLGVRVDKLEKGASTIKFTGDARIRWQKRDGADLPGVTQAGRIQERVRLYMTADVNDNVKFYGRLVAMNENNVRNNAGDPGVSNTNGMYVDRAEFAWKNGNWGVSAGRMLPKLGQGIFAWADRVDGVIGSYNDGKFSGIAGVFDAGTGTGNVVPKETKTLNVSLAQLGYQVTDNIGLTAMYANAHGDANEKATFWAGGGNVKFAQNWELRGEYIKNTEDVFEDQGAFARLTYGEASMKKVGSYAAYVEYIKFGAGSGAALVNGSYFDIAGSVNATDGRKGWGLGVTYVVGKNHNVQAFYHDLKSFDGGTKYKGQYTLATNFNF